MQNKKSWIELLSVSIIVVTIIIVTLNSRFSLCHIFYIRDVVCNLLVIIVTSYIATEFLVMVMNCDSYITESISCVNTKFSLVVYDKYRIDWSSNGSQSFS
jgi:hypothetical protein